MLLALVAAVPVVPLAWVLAAVARWLCRNTEFSDGTTVEFRGTGGEIAVWSVFLVLIAVGQQFLLRAVAAEGLLAMIVVVAVGGSLMLYILLMLTKWFFYNLKISPGPALQFSGSYLSLLGRSLLVALLSVTIVGWAWGVAALYRWMAESVKGRGMRFEFHGQWHEILWRGLVATLGSLPIVTIPFLKIWLMRWLAQNVTMTRVEENEWLSEPSSEPVAKPSVKPRSKPKQSSPGSHPSSLHLD
jgi:hypothetical protein